MGLCLVTSDDKKSLAIGYFTFSHMRSYFILSYKEKWYSYYRQELVKSVDDFCSDTTISAREIAEDLLFQKEMGDLNILINHSDCGGELTYEECVKLRPALKINKGRMEKYITGDRDVDFYISYMEDFIELIDYCIDNHVTLLFG